ncbi:MAG: GIY-YIG nuclease family protein [Chitinophagaceae bacterium]
MIYPNQPQELYYVYIIVCKDDSFYIGLTNDLIKRFEEHCEGIYETCYTFKRRPLALAYYETIPFLQDAINREKQLKGWTRAKKITLIKQDYYNLQLLAQCKNLSHHKYKDLK